MNLSKFAKLLAKSGLTFYIHFELLSIIRKQLLLQPIDYIKQDMKLQRHQN